MPDTAQFRKVHNLPEHGCLAQVGVSGVCGCLHCVRDASKKKETGMPADKIEIQRTGELGRVVVDGYDISEWVSRETMEVSVDFDNPGRVRLTLQAKSVQVSDELSGQQ